MKARDKRIAELGEVLTDRDRVLAKCAELESRLEARDKRIAELEALVRRISDPPCMREAREAGVTTRAIRDLLVLWRDEEIATSRLVEALREMTVGAAERMAAAPRHEEDK